MKTVLVSISLLLFSILLVIGCEVIDKNLQEANQHETEIIQQTSDIEEIDPRLNNIELMDFEVDSKEKLQNANNSDS